MLKVELVCCFEVLVELAVGGGVSQDPCQPKRAFPSQDPAGLTGRQWASCNW